jgi:hypothetical protein
MNYNSLKQNGSIFKSIYETYKQVKRISFVRYNNLIYVWYYCENIKITLIYYNFVKLI